MLAYSQLTLRQLLDETLLRAGRYRTKESTSDEELIALANKAIKEVMVKTLPYKNYAYTSTMGVTHLTTVPRHYIKYIRVLLSTGGYAPYEEARYVDPKEWYSLTDWRKKDKWRKGTAMAPLFTLWGSAGSMLFMCYPNSQHQTGAVPTGYEYISQSEEVRGLLEYHSVPDDIWDTSAIVPILYEHEEYLIQSTLSRYLAKKLVEEQLIDSYQIISAERTKLFANFMTLRGSRKASLDNFVPEVEGSPTFRNPRQR